jgi:transposase InsO family protein
VISDGFTKLTVAIPISDQTASTVAQSFVDRWMLYFGFPIVLLTENGSNFASMFMGVLTQMIGIKHVYTSAYRPSENGQVERFNSTLSDSLTMLSATGKDWDHSVGLACFSFTPLLIPARDLPRSNWPALVLLLLQHGRASPM